MLKHGALKENILGDLIRSKRTELNLTAQQVITKMGRSSGMAYLTRVELGKTLPSFPFLARLCHELKMPFDEIGKILIDSYVKRYEQSLDNSYAKAVEALEKERQWRQFDKDLIQQSPPDTRRALRKQLNTMKDKQWL
jgi:transcriptional regulator with XRE-family HTH domain